MCMGAYNARCVCVVGGHAWQGRGVHGKGNVRGRRDGHCSGRYASYWNAFLFYSVCGQAIVIFFFVSDVHSYAEDEMVEDPWLTKHLAHFGINITQLEKVK